MKARRARDGYVLTETLAAFAILAMGLTALTVGVGGAVRADAHARFQSAALLAGQAELAALGVARPLAPGSVAGRTLEGLEWRLTISRHGDGARRGAPAAFWAEIEIREPAARASSPQSLALIALKLQPLSQGPPP